MPALRLERAFIDGLKIHDVTDPENPFALSEASITRPPRRNVSPRSQAHGSRDLTRFVEGGIFTLAGIVEAFSGDAADTEAAMDALEAIVWTFDEPHEFRFLRLGRLEEERSLVKLSALDAPSKGFEPMIRYAMTLESEDPRIYSAALRVANYDPTDAVGTGGTAIPLVFPLVFTATTDSQVAVTNDGSWLSPPLLIIRGPVGNPVVDNDTLGESIAVNYVLGTSDVVEIDVADRSIYLNGALRRDLYDPQTSTWWQLAPGENLLRLRGSGMVNDVTNLEVQWRDAR